MIFTITTTTTVIGISTTMSSKQKRLNCYNNKSTDSNNDADDANTISNLFLGEGHIKLPKAI